MIVFVPTGITLNGGGLCGPVGLVPNTLNRSKETKRTKNTTEERCKVDYN